MSLELTTVIVNYRTAELTIRCLESLESEVHSCDMNVVVVDNDSQDGSAEQIEAALKRPGWPQWTTLIKAPRNGGFGYGCNLGLAHALSMASQPRYIWFLNPDTVVQAGAARALLGFLHQSPDVGIVGSRLEAPDGSAQCSAFRFPTIWSELEAGLKLGAVSRLLKDYVVAPPVREQPHLTDWVSGASMVVRADVFDSIGAFDEGYFLYYEEVDFCRRAALAGFRCSYFPGGRVTHWEGQSTGVSYSSSKRQRRPRYWFESRKRYFLKHHGRFYCAVADGLFVAGYALWRIRRRIQRKSDLDPAWFLLDFLKTSIW